MSKEFYARLAAIQENLNAPKNQYNSFGKYKYRSCEDILEGVKPLLNGLFLSISDEVVLIGDRYYVKATATITDGENSHTATALAREEESKKGMDSAQVTGATSSYARKYCLNGLFGNRYFGTVTEALELDTAKNGYILLVQDAEPNFDVNGNSPVTPDGWISCSERMPNRRDGKPPPSPELGNEPGQVFAAW